MLILVDMDGVLCNYGAAFDKAWKTKYPDAPWFPSETATTFFIKDQYPEEWHEQTSTINVEPGFFRNLEPISGGVEALRALEEAGHVVRICTAPLTNYQNCVLEKHEWVEEHLGVEWVRKVTTTKDKVLVAGDVLIDDKPDISGLIVPSWTHVRFDAPYNRLSGHTLLNWSNYVEVLAEVEKERRKAGTLLTLRTS